MSCPKPHMADGLATRGTSAYVEAIREGLLKLQEADRVLGAAYDAEVREHELRTKWKVPEPEALLPWPRCACGSPAHYNTILCWPCEHARRAARSSR